MGRRQKHGAVEQATGDPWPVHLRNTLIVLAMHLIK